MSRVELAKIKALTFYKDSVTAYRRTSALPQLHCIGKPCRVYQPEVVRCTNIGGSGTDVDWKCEADLPESLRFGKVEVSCEGYSRPGDSYVLKGSCALEYRLVQVPGSLLKDDNSFRLPQGYNWNSALFSVLWVGVLILIVYSFLASCLRSDGTTRRTTRPSGSGRPGSNSGGSWFPGQFPDNNNPPPPPYSKTEPSQPGWRPGFWTGAALGGLANHLWNRPREPPRTQASYDWELFRSQRSEPRSSWFGTSSSYRPQTSQSDDRGEGSSNLGSMRRSTGFGGTAVR